MSSRVLVGLAVVFLGLALGFLVGWAVGAACPDLAALVFARAGGGYPPPPPPLPFFLASPVAACGGVASSAGCCARNPGRFFFAGFFCPRLLPVIFSRASAAWSCFVFFGRASCLFFPWAGRRCGLPCPCCVSLSSVFCSC